MISLKVHWYAVTVWGDEVLALALWDAWLARHLGPLQPTGHGGRGFRKIYNSLVAGRVYCDPPEQDATENRPDYFHIELPGSACDCIPDEDIKEFTAELYRWRLENNFKVTRLDLAWDGVRMHPLDFSEAVELEMVRTLAKRSSLSVFNQPYEDREDGVQGTASVSLGSRASSRMIRVYNKRGPTRVEFQMRQDRAHEVALDVLLASPSQWHNKALSHLLDYVDISRHDLYPGWGELVQEVDRAYKTVSDARQLEMDNLAGWLMKQVSPALSVLNDVMGEGAV
ncbi:replication initiation factor domain-containing protein, partial [Chloroflexota bacterium]